jgi:glycosyltransferase involved in cell wall biosynthesis
MRIAVCIPVIDHKPLTKRCIEVLGQNTLKLDELCIIDNASEEPYRVAELLEWTGFPDIKHIVSRQEKNQGMLGSLKIAMQETTADVIVYPHNDVLIHEKDWDRRVLGAFNSDPKLGIAGFFGARGVGKDGGRWHCESNMLGKEWGTSWQHHSAFSDKVTPATILDGLCMIFRRTALAEIGVPDGPPHHWYDRYLPLMFIEKGWRCATIGIAFDHQGGMTSTRAGYQNFAKQWCLDHGITPEGDNPDLAIYRLGEALFRNRFASRLPLKVDDRWNYTWNSQ